jgi:succinate dehydrogenase hydrophobic anchor subunit
MSEEFIHNLHTRDGSLRHVFIANIFTASILFGLLISSLVLLIIGKHSNIKSIVDFCLSTFFFIAVVLLIVSDFFEDNKLLKFFKYTRNRRDDKS